MAAGDLITQFTDHEGRVARFIEQFKNKPDLDALARTYLKQIQDLEDAAFEVILERDLDNAVGVQLATIAKIVKAPITTTDDDALRIIIRTQIAINLSSGTGEDLINVLRLILFASAEAFHFRDEPPLQCRLIIDDPLSLTIDPNVAIQLLDSADLAANRVLLDYHLDAEDDVFTFADSDGNNSTMGKGFADQGGGGTDEGSLASTTDGGN